MGAVKALLTLLKDCEKHDVLIELAEEVDKLLLTHDQSDYAKALKIIEKMNEICDSPLPLSLSFSLKKTEQDSFVIKIWRLESIACISK